MVCVVLKITPNFSFALIPASYEEGGDTVVRGIFLGAKKRSGGGEDA